MSDSAAAHGVQFSFSRGEAKEASECHMPELGICISYLLLYNKLSPNLAA